MANTKLNINDRYWLKAGIHKSDYLIYTRIKNGT